MPTLTERFPADPRSVGEARRALRSALAEWGFGAGAADAAQVVTELATNAILHAGTPFTLAVTAEDGAVRVAVSDGSPRRPVRRRGSAQATTGRGMAVVEALSTVWGVDDHPGGKTVWCVLPGAAAPAGGGATDARSPRPGGSPRVDGRQQGKPDAGRRRSRSCRQPAVPRAA